MVGWNIWVSARTAANHKGKWGQCIGVLCVNWQVNDREDDRYREGNNGDLFFILIIEKIQVSLVCVSWQMNNREANRCK